MWSAIEVAAAVVSACLPVLRPIYIWIFHGRSGLETINQTRHAEIRTSRHELEEGISSRWKLKSGPSSNQGTAMPCFAIKRQFGLLKTS